MRCIETRDENEVLQKKKEMFVEILFKIMNLMEIMGLMRAQKNAVVPTTVINSAIIVINLLVVEK